MSEPPLRPWVRSKICVKDLDEVLELEQRAQPAPWSRALFLEEMKQPQGQLDVLRDARGQLLGYTDCWWVLDELHILNVVTDPKFRRRGCAKYMLQHLFEQAQAKNSLYASLEVRVTNEGALRLYKGLGFEEVGRRPKYYRDNGEDALILACILPGTGPS